MIKNQQYFGLVEGFFAKPYPMWGWDDRNIILDELIGTGNLNTYFYCPKDDPKITVGWEEFYTNEEIGRFNDFIQRCSKTGTTFVYGLNPPMNSYKDVENNLESYITKISKKFNQLKNLGVGTFCILYDDIPLAYTALEGKSSYATTEYARVQCLVVNAVQESLGYGCKLWFCSSEYFFTKKNLYIKTLNKYLNKCVVLIWTGSRVFTKKITKRLLINAKNTVGNRELIWWDNYPVNDPMSVGYLNLGGFNEPDLGVLPNLKGIMVNPMREVALNIPYLATFSKYLKSPNNYSRKKMYANELGNYYKTDNTIRACLIEFSNRSAIDDVMKYGYIKINNLNTDPEADSFLKELSEIYIDIKRKHLSEDFKLLKSIIFSLTTLAKIGKNRQDYFPIPLDATYMNRVLLIVLLRLLLNLKARKVIKNDYRKIKTLINRVKDSKSLNLNNLAVTSVEFSTACELYNKYLGFNKVELSPGVRKKIETALFKLVNWENEYFLRIVKKLGKIGKLRIFSLRLNINQYGLKKLLTEIDHFEGEL